MPSTSFSISNPFQSLCSKVLYVFCFWKTSKLSQPVKGSLLWWQVSHSIPNLHPRGRGKERGREWGEGERKKESDSQWQPQAKLRETLIWTLLERDEAVSYIPAQKKGATLKSQGQQRDSTLLPPQGCPAPVPRGDVKENRARTGWLQGSLKRRANRRICFHKWRPASPSSPLRPRPLLTWSITGAVGRVEAGIVGRGSCRVGCGVTYKDIEEKPHLVRQGD